MLTWRAGFASAISDLPPSRRHVAWAISAHMTSKGGGCFVSVPTIAAETGYCTRTVFYCLAELVGRGWLVKESRPGRTNLYGAAVPSWWAAAATKQGLDVLAGLDEGGGAEEATPSSSSPLRRAHTWLERVGWQYERSGALAELEAMVGEVAAGALLERWHELREARAGPLADAA